MRDRILNLIETIVCRTLGCGSPLSRLSSLVVLSDWFDGRVDYDGEARVISGPLWARALVRFEAFTSYRVCNWTARQTERFRPVRPTHAEAVAALSASLIESAQSLSLELQRIADKIDADNARLDAEAFDYGFNSYDGEDL